MNLGQNFQKEECCGCRACYNICPTKAIQMSHDEKGSYILSLTRINASIADFVQRYVTSASSLPPQLLPIVML